MTDHLSDLDNANPPQSADWDAIARHVAGENTPESMARVDALMSETPERDLIASLQGVTNQMAGNIPTNIDVEAALRSVKGRMSEGALPALKVESGRSARTPAPATRWRVSVPAMAAAGLLVVGLGSWLALGKRNEPATVATSRMVATGVGVRDSLTLSDGTRVVLGPLSSVRVYAAYASASREVEVKGDAYFEVVHDSSKPFTVYAGNATIRDVGTKFAVSNDSGDIGVSVREGAVSLAQAKSQEPATVLKAGDQGTLDRGGKVVARRGAATDEDLAWLNGRLVFRESPLSEVASSMRRWYGIDLQIADPSLATRHITATFSGEPPERVLEVLRLALGADIERHGDTAVVRSAKGKAR